jgi:hypothetical protein
MTEPQHHPLDRAWLVEVNAAHHAYAQGDTNITEFRRMLTVLRVKHNRVLS